MSRGCLFVLHSSMSSSVGTLRFLPLFGETFEKFRCRSLPIAAGSRQPGYSCYRRTGEVNSLEGRSRGGGPRIAVMTIPCTALKLIGALSRFYEIDSRFCSLCGGHNEDNQYQRRSGSSSTWVPEALVHIDCGSTGLKATALSQVLRF
jgi:hypothetical protein